MFGKRSGTEGDSRMVRPAAVAPEPAPGAAAAPRPPAPPAVPSPPLAPAKPAPPPPVVETRRSDTYYQVKATIFGALI
ncbi:MAG: CpaF family protein, partial [Bradyrhizobium sp.]